MMKPLSTLSMAIAMMAAPAIAWGDDLTVVYDASGSMWGKIDGATKIEIARDVMAGVVETWDDDTNIGLIAYGHRREDACADIETLIEPAPISREGFLDTVNGLNPRGRTPLLAAVERATEAIAYRENRATVFLISDGIENCQDDPRVLSERLARQGIDFTAHVIGVDVTTDEYRHLACIAENTGGEFVSAQNADELRDALAHVQSVVDRQPMPPSQPAMEAEPEPSPDVVVTGPDMTPIGSRFAVEWSPTHDSREMIAIVPAGADEAGNEGSSELTAPAEPGLYELRYMPADGQRTLGYAPIKVTEAAITLTAPATATTGAEFTVQWDVSIDSRDIIALVPMRADEAARGNWNRVGNAGSSALTAPVDPGLYELRYILEEGQATLASLPIEVEGAEVTFEGPGEAVRAGSKVEVRWSQTIATQDLIAVIPLGADNSKLGNWRRAGKSTHARISAPDDVGLYEVRYVLNEGGRVLASETFEVVAADAPLDAGAGLSVPDRVSGGDIFEVTWGIDSDRARIALARADQADFT